MVQSYKNESKSQRRCCHLISSRCCDVWYKVTKMRANHNRPLSSLRTYVAVMYGTKLQKWEQITTVRAICPGHSAVMYGTKLQKWEQITTCYSDLWWRTLLWCMVQSYKNESKSQRLAQNSSLQSAVMYGTKLQKWEQITTELTTDAAGLKLWCMVQSYKNESKSQPYCDKSTHLCGCDVWYKVTKMRANHNSFHSLCILRKAVMYGTKLQKWEQITTKSLQQNQVNSCDVWYKVTKMRANHNMILNLIHHRTAVMYGTKLQKWEQITTALREALEGRRLWCMVQSYKNESKSQLNGRLSLYISMLWCMVQSYKNESKSQR